MQTVPKTFCITLRETPKRKEEAQKYFEQVGLKAEFVDGIHGEAFGVKSVIPNYTVLSGREYFITPGETGRILSHISVWNTLQQQTEEEFLIVEDDIQLCTDFFEKFAKFKLDLPLDWEFAYVGYTIDEENAKDTTYVSETVVSCKPKTVCAYLVKKSALKTLLETNHLAWNSLATQIAERSLPKLTHYASKESLILNRSKNDKKGEVWSSLCHDWNLDPEWMNDNSTGVCLGNGWYPLEKNSEGYMIWSDGRAEFLLDAKWIRMEVDVILEGEMDKKIRIVCPQQADHVFDMDKYGVHHLSFDINGASSVIVVSDTFRPVDIFKTSDARRLGLRFLKGITLTNAEGKSTFMSLYSLFGAKKEKGSPKDTMFRFIKPKNKPEGKINLTGQPAFNAHRSGWGYVLNLLTDYHRDDAPLMETWIDRTFGWYRDQNSYQRLIPFRQPWVGFMHNPPGTPNWFTDNSTPSSIICSREFQDSLPLCKGIYVLSKHHANFLKCFIKTVPIEALYHPTETPELKFSFDEFVKNNDKKIVNIGWWCRKLSSIYKLEVDRSIYQKIRLIPPTHTVADFLLGRLLDIECSFDGKPLSDDVKSSVVDVSHMPNEEYDHLLSRNIAFLDLFDASANNAIIECMARGTPILVSPVPSVVEYLGEGYPFYFSSLEEASKKLKNIALIKATHDYLRKEEVLEKIRGETFLKTIQEGEIWKSLT